MKEFYSSFLSVPSVLSVVKFFPLFPFLASWRFIRSSKSIAQANLPHKSIRRLVGFAHPIDDALRLRRIL
jgi:hypothetical protein